MPTFCSHTLVRNGMPFIGRCLRQVIPYMDRCLITISRKSNDGTVTQVTNLRDEFPGKVFLTYENVSKPADLTKERQMQIGRTWEDWILFLDDDDYWPESSIDSVMKIIRKWDNRIDGLAANPIQLVDSCNQDNSWRYRWFTKWFRNQPGLHYEEDWPMDLIFLRNDILFWRKNKRVLQLPQDARFFHLSHLKGGSFRSEEWANERYGQGIGELQPVPDRYKFEAQEIYGYFRGNK